MKQGANSSSSHITTAHKEQSHYRRLLMMTALSFIAMYVLMYSMVNAIEEESRSRDCRVKVAALATVLRH